MPMHMLLAKFDLPCSLGYISSSSFFFFFLAHWRDILPSDSIRARQRASRIIHQPHLIPHNLTQPAKTLPIPSNSITHPTPLLISPPPPHHHPLSSSLLLPPTPPPLSLSLLIPSSTSPPNVHYPLVASPFSSRKNVISLRDRGRGVLCVRGRLVDFFIEITISISININLQNYSIFFSFFLSWRGIAWVGGMMMMKG